MKIRWRPIFATILVLGCAAFAYIHAVPTTIDLDEIPDPADPAHPALTDLPTDIRNLDGQLVAVDGYMIPMDEADRRRRIGIVPGSFFSSRSWPSSQLIGTNWDPAFYMKGNIHVVGRLHIRSDIVEGYVVSFDEMDVEQIIPIYTGDTATWPWAVFGIGIATAVAVPLWRRAKVRRRLHRAGCCIRCGYDLRATPIRCPECGLVI